MKKFYIEFQNFGGWMVEANDQEAALRKARDMILDAMSREFSEKNYVITEQE